MNNNLKDLEMMLQDIERFIFTLIIVSSYLYVGAVINTYFRPSNDSVPLFLLTGLAIVSLAWLLYKQNKIINKINEQSMDN